MVKIKRTLTLKEIQAQSDLRINQLCECFIEQYNKDKEVFPVKGTE